MEAAKARTGGGPARVVTSMLTRNLGAKGLALVCAIVLWLYMREQVQTDHDEYFEVLASGSEASYMIAYPESEDLIIRPETGSDRIRINFAGPTEQVNTIKNGRIRGTIPASVFDEWLRAGEEEGTLAVGLGDIEFPFDGGDELGGLGESADELFVVEEGGEFVAVGELGVASETEGFGFVGVPGAFVSLEPVGEDVLGSVWLVVGDEGAREIEDGPVDRVGRGLGFDPCLL